MTEPTPARPLRLAYLTNQYPAVSHTFIRRELRAVERLGHEVLRASIRPPAAALVDPEDIAEQARTFCCLAAGRRRLAAAVLAEAFTRPARLARAAASAARWSRKGHAGLLKHMAYLAEAALLRRHFAAHRVEHVHVHFGTNPATVARLIRLLGGPGYSFTVHGPDEFDDPRGHDLAGKVADARFAVGISDFTRSQLQRWTDPADWPRIHAVRCTVGDGYLGRPPADPPEGPPTFINVGRLSAQKGQLVLIDAMARLAQSGVDARLVIVGDGELRPHVESAIARANLHDRIELTGSLPGEGVRRRLAQAHALVLASSAEGLPMVIMEAFATGVPVISTWVAGIPELVEHPRSGLLVPPGRADLLAHAMATLASMSAHERASMAALGRAAVQARHHTPTEAARLAALFQASVEAGA